LTRERRMGYTLCPGGISRTWCVDPSDAKIKITTLVRLGAYCEKDLSAIGDQAETRSWFPLAYVNRERAGGDSAPSSKGPQTVVRLTCYQQDEPAVPGQERFPSAERLTRKADYQRIYQEGDKWVGPAFICFVFRRPGERRRLGLAVSKKVGGAVVRNRIKRYLREIYRRRRSELADGMDLAIVARTAAATLTYTECETAIGQLFQKGDVLRA
jgi:ribonuclease P protein component